LTSEPASDYFVADVVTYANSAKTGILGVSEELLRERGAVSAEVAAAMAEGVRKVCQADIGVAVTGIAGPSGGSPEKPVGLVYWAAAHGERKTVVRERIFPGDRRQVQMFSAYASLSLVRDVVLGRAG
jgi:nicotinamide-nucleotide amidase